MKKLLLLAMAVVVVLTFPSLCMAQKCRVITGAKLMTFADPHAAFHWATMKDKETASNLINRMNDTGQIRMVDIGTQVYTIDKLDFSVYSVHDFPMYQVADFHTKKPIGWIFGHDLKGLKPCK